MTGDPRRRFARSMRVALGGALALLLVSVSPAAALEQKLIAADGSASDRLGASVAIQGETIVLGASREDGGRGSVYVFQRFGDSWTNTAKLAASDGAPGDGLGSSVAIDGDTIVAGAPGEAIGANRGQGSIYTFAATGPAVRSETAKLTAADGGAGDNLGTSVSIDAIRSSAAARATSLAQTAARARCTRSRVSGRPHARRQRS